MPAICQLLETEIDAQVWEDKNTHLTENRAPHCEGNQGTKTSVEPRAMCKMPAIRLLWITEFDALVWEVKNPHLPGHRAAVPLPLI